MDVPTRPTHRYRSVIVLDRSGSAEIVGTSWVCSDHLRPGRMRLTELLPSEDVR